MSIRQTAVEYRKGNLGLDCPTPQWPPITSRSSVGACCRDDSTELHFSSDDVPYRFRPQNSIEIREGGEIVVNFDENLQTVKPKSTANLVGPEKDGFTFDRVFPMGTKQHEVFDYGVSG